MNQYHYGHLVERELPRKDEYLSATHSIQDSFTGVVEVLALHRLFAESALELRNSIQQFESGYVGAAFYSVRSAVELARVVTFFSGVNNPIESDIYRDWRTGGKFPFDNEIKKQIEKTSDIYLQVKSATKPFFEDRATELRRYQKYIHKQGYAGFYERGFTKPENEAKRNQIIESDFINYFENSLSEIGLLRLCIDPFPILLNDDAVRKKIHFESMTYPYSDELLEIIGHKLIEQYKSTGYYNDYVQYFSANIELSEECLTLINDSYYRRADWPSIEPYMGSLNLRDKTAVNIFNTSKKIAKIYALGGFEQWFSDVKSTREKLSWSSESLIIDLPLNSAYDGAFLSYFNLSGEEYWLEHISKFTAQEAEQLNLLNTAVE